MAVDADFAKLAKIAVREGSRVSRYLTAEVGVAATLVGGLLASILAVVQVWYAKRADDKAVVPGEIAITAPVLSEPAPPASTVR